MKKSITVALATATMAVSASYVYAAEGEEAETVLRARVINIDPDTSSSIPGLDVDSQVAPEIGLTYFFSPNVGLDIGVATAEHDVTLSGANIGTVQILPINITGIYRFQMQRLQPYVGAGLNYTRFTSVDLVGGAVDVDSSSIGPVIQAGLDWPIANNLVVNADIKKIWLDTEVTGAASGSLDVDPLVYGVGIGWRF
jgi:outer membrane protein